MKQNILDRMMSSMCDEKKEKLVSTMKVRDEWRPKLDAMKQAKQEARDILEQLEKAQAKYETLKKAFWSEVEIDLNDFGNPMTYNMNTDEIEIKQYVEDEE
jgi:hypothetical protein